MAYVISPLLFDKVRARLAWDNSKVSKEANINLRTLQRILNRKNSPNKKTLKKLYKNIPELQELLIWPYPHQQEAVSKQAMLALQENKSVKEVEYLVDKGLAISGGSRKNYIGKPLLGFEPELLHIIAKLEAREKNIPGAIEMLKNLLLNLELFPHDDKTKEMQTIPMLLTLAALQTQTDDNQTALELCDYGFEMCVRRAQGKFCPDFLHLKANILLAKGERDTDLYRILLTKAYAGHIALQNKEAANTVLQNATKKFNMAIETHNMETVLRNTPVTVYNFPKEPVSFKNLGHMLTVFGNECGLPKKVIYNGLCSASIFCKLESNEIGVPDAFMVEALMQRMGRDINLYYNFYVPIIDYELIQLRDKVSVKTRGGLYDETTKELINNLEELLHVKRYKSLVAQQFIDAAKAAVYVAEHKYTQEYLEMLESAIKLTIPDFNKRFIQDYPLTVRESVIINQMAIYYKKTGNMLYAEQIYYGLLKSITAYWHDEILKSRMYATVSFNYSNYLGPAGQREKALEVIDRALEYGMNRGNLIGLANLFYNKGFNLKELGHTKSETLPLFVLSCYCDLIFETYGRAENAQLTKEFVKKEYGKEI